MVTSVVPFTIIAETSMTPEFAADVLLLERRASIMLSSISAPNSSSFSTSFALSSFLKLRTEEI